MHIQVSILDKDYIYGQKLVYMSLPDGVLWIRLFIELFDLATIAEEQHWLASSSFLDLVRVVFL